MKKLGYSLPFWSVDSNNVQTFTVRLANAILALGHNADASETSTS